MAGANFFFGDVETKNPGNSSSDGRAHYRNRLGVVELVGREPLIFARVENGVTKFSPKKQQTQTPKKWIINSTFQSWEFSFFAAERRKTNLGGGITSKLASQ